MLILIHNYYSSSGTVSSPIYCILIKKKKKGAAIALGRTTQQFGLVLNLDVMAETNEYSDRSTEVSCVDWVMCACVQKLTVGHYRKYCCIYF